MAIEKDVGQMSIYERLAAIRKTVKVFKKDKQAFGYKYTPEDVILQKITAEMDKYNLMLIPSIVPNSRDVIPYITKKTKVPKTGEPYEENVNEVIVSADTVYTWLCIDKPDERIAVSWLLVGQQSDAAQAGGSGLTYFQRYFLLKFFNAATTEDDPDNWRAKQKEAADKEGKEIADEIIKQFDTDIRVFFADYPEKKDEVIKFLAKYAKNSNYLSIHDPVMAKKLVEDFNNTYKKEGAK